MELTQSQLKLRNDIREAKHELNVGKLKLSGLLQRCHKHVAEKHHDGATCAVCTLDLGWWCPDSPDHVCDYSQPDGSYDEDQCRFCGDPEERK